MGDLGPRWRPQQPILPVSEFHGVVIALALSGAALALDHPAVLLKSGGTGAWPLSFFAKIFTGEVFSKVDF